MSCDVILVFLMVTQLFPNDIAMHAGHGVGGMGGVVRYRYVALWYVLSLLLIVMVECGLVMMNACVGGTGLHIVLLVMPMGKIIITNLTYGADGITNGDL